jgi:hypothetical protein
MVKHEWIVARTEVYYVEAETRLEAENFVEKNVSKLKAVRVLVTANLKQKGMS